MKPRTKQPKGMENLRCNSMVSLLYSLLSLPTFFILLRISPRESSLRPFEPFRSCGNIASRSRFKSYTSNEIVCADLRSFATLWILPSNILKVTVRLFLSGIILPLLATMVLWVSGSLWSEINTPFMILPLDDI